MAWLALPGAVWLMGFVWRELAFVLFPASIGTGILLMLYGSHLRHVGRGDLRFRYEGTTADRVRGRCGGGEWA